MPTGVAPSKARDAAPGLEDLAFQLVELVGHGHAEGDAVDLEERRPVVVVAERADGEGGRVRTAGVGHAACLPERAAGRV